MKIRTLALVSAAALSACAMTTTQDAGSSVSSSAISSIRETQNITYIGVVEPAGISVYTEGSHRLVLPEGKFVLLESSTVDLNGYVNEKVMVFGSIRPTVEAGGMVMRVTEIQLQDSSSSSSKESSAETSSVPSRGSSALSSAFATVSSVAISPSSSTAAVESSETQSSLFVSSLAEKSSLSSVPASSASSVASSQADLSLKIETMSRQNFAPSLWTQQYCTSHIGFCLPIHKNWWFKSFGTTTVELWRVEISSEPVENLGEGPIVVRLLTDSRSADDGTVKTEGGTVTFVKSWTFDRHFEIVADARLSEAVRYIGSTLSVFDDAR
ncbi:hypothetical protein FJZ28_02735 [Candidatus Peregrinibacteria bacterium]|nr:hypothetical protein [Candidatus Peregrinibacteria bacterium]